MEDNEGRGLAYSWDIIVALTAPSNVLVHPALAEGDLAGAGVEAAVAESDLAFSHIL